jgi:hypothetical protein
LGVFLRDLTSVNEQRVRRVLKKLEDRSDALEQPLGFCLVWCFDKGSAVADSVHQARSLLVAVERFLTDLATKSSATIESSIGLKRSLLDSDFDSETVIAQGEEFLKELEYAVNALNLALSIVSASKSLQDMTKSSFRGAPLSYSSLLRASGRLVEMKDKGGHLTFNVGRLFEANVSEEKKWVEK